MNFGLTKKKLRQFDKAHKRHVWFFYNDESFVPEYYYLDKPISRIGYFECMKALGLI